MTNCHQFVQRYRQSVPEEDDWWTVYVIGIYESPEANIDNEPNDELCSPGFTFERVPYYPYEVSPEYTAVCFEHLRDLAA